MLKNTKKVFSLILAIAVVAMSMFTGVVVSAADPVETAHGTVDLLEFSTTGENLPGSTSKYYDTKLDDNGETGADWANAIIIDSAEEFVYLCKASGNDTIGKYYKVADGIAGFNLATDKLDIDGTLTGASLAEGKTNMDVVKGSGKNHSGGTPGFQGHFDGNGATVYGAWTNHTEGNVANYAGLFSRVKGEVTIKNLHVKMAHFTAKNVAGGIIGYHAADEKCTVTIENCSVTDSYLETQGTGWGTSIGAILGYGASAPAKREANDQKDYNGDGDMVDTIYQDCPYIVKNCYVNLNEENFVSSGEDGVESEGERVCHGGVAGVLGSNALSVSDCVVIGIKPYAMSESTSFNDVQHSGLPSHFANVYTTSNVAIKDVVIGGNGAVAAPQSFEGKVFPLVDAKLKGAAAAENMNLDWSVWMADEEGYPELANTHKNVTLVDKEDGTHAVTCACGFGGIAVDHNFVNGECACGAELNCATRKTIAWDGSVAAGIATGSGTKDDPYIIKTAAELAWLVQQKADVTTDKYYEIDESIGAIVLQSADKAEDIMALDSAAATKAYFEAGSFTPWKTMGWEASCFAGHFDGNGATIYGLYAPSINNAALFSTVDGGSAIRNIAVKNSYFTSSGGNYQVGALIGTSSNAGYGAKRQGIVWVSDVVIANNYMYNNAAHPTTGAVEHLRSGIIGGVQEAMHVENCLAYGNDATYNDGYKMPLVANVTNAVVPAATHYDGFEPKISVNESTGETFYYNVVRNTVVLGADIMNTKDGRDWRKNDPDCYENCYTDGASGTVALSNGEWTYADEQIKAITEDDLATLALGDAFINTDSYPELKAFHDAVFAGDPTPSGAAGHSAACSCGLADSNLQPHNFVSDTETPEWDSYYCSVCGYVCEHVPEEEGITEYEGDCLTAAGYEYNCPLCNYHEEAFEDVPGHDFTVHEAQKGADCQTAGTIAYKSCSACEKNFAAEATELEPFENAITDLTGEYGDHEVLVEADMIVYGKDDTNHWTQCATCGEPIETEEHNLTVEPNGAQGHSASCEICGYEADNVPHTFGDDNICDVEGCAWECTDHQFVDGAVKTPGDCVTDKVIEQVCSICGTVGDDRVETAPGHTPADAVEEVKVPGDCVTDKTYDMVVYCAVCDEELSRTPGSVTAPGHNYKKVVTKATTSKNGKIENKCTVCGDVESTTTIKYAKTFSLSSTSYTYDGKTKTPTVTVKDSAGTKLKKNVDYTLSVASSRKNVGTYKVTVKMIGNYSGTKYLYFKINPAKLGSCKLSATTYTYSGKNKTPTVTVKNAAGTKLTKNTHYTLSVASSRYKVGTYKVTVKGKGNYTGTKYLYFKILPVKTTVSKLTAGKKSITVNITKKSTQVTGYQIQYSTSKKFTSAKTKTISSYKTTKYTLKSLSAKKTYYVRVRTYKTVSGKKYYSGWSTYKYVKTK